MIKSPAELVRENPNCNYFISASAGTGKTYTLTNYYMGILEYWENYNKPDIVDNILAVTFTNKAANEMKDRIMSEVRKKIQATSNIYWQRVYSNMSRAVISTIDSLCRRILVEQNITAGVDPNFKIINELKQMKIIDNVSKYAIEVAFQIYEDIDVKFRQTLPVERRKRLENYVSELRQNKEAILELFKRLENIDTVKKHIANVVKNWRIELNYSKISERLLSLFKKVGTSLNVFRLMCLIAVELYEAETLDNFEYDFKGTLEKVISLLQKEEQVRKQYQERFKYIIVDEYQDTNDLQRTLFEMLHTDNNYVFYVGDRKQSIYRFRGADVSVFIKTMNEFEKKQKDSPEKYKILSLQTNFRSHKDLVKYFNYVSKEAIFCSKIKSDSPCSNSEDEVNGVNYYEVFRLRFPELYDKLFFLDDDISNANNQGCENETLPQVNLEESYNLRRVVYMCINDREKLNNNTYMEALLVAKVINELVGKEMTFFEKDSSGLKPVKRKITYKDITILSYKLSSVEDTYKDVFAKFNIPLYVVKGRSFYKRPEIKSIISALNVIQNPNNNYNFMEFFFTPFFEDTEVKDSFDKFKIFHKIVSKAKEIKDKEGTYSLFQAAKELSNSGSLPNYVSEMIQLIQKYDEMKYFLRPAEVMKNFIKESNYLTKIAKFDGSEQKLKNVKKLMDQASEFNQQANSFLELTRLFEKITDLQEMEASQVSEENDVVKMMTVHASKGLEFNIVFLVGNSESEKDEENVMFPVSDDGDGRYLHIKRFLDKFKDEINSDSEEYKELIKQLEAEVIFDETELLRKMYVAITRAKDMLFVVLLPDGNKNKALTAKKIFEREHDDEHIMLINISKNFLEEINLKSQQDNEYPKDEQEILDEAIVEKQISDLSEMAYKRYLSPTILSGILDEKSDFEIDHENLEEVNESENLISYPSKISDKLSKFLESSSEILEGKQIHRKLMSVNEYNQIVYLAQTGQIPQGILKAHILKELFENSKVLSEWRLAKHFEVNEKKYVLFGIPDKVFFKDNKIYVVDFKCTYLSWGTLELEKFIFQMQFYMYLLKDFGKVERGYIVNTKTGWVVTVECPDEKFTEQIAEKIRLFESAEVVI